MSDYTDIMSAVFGKTITKQQMVDHILACNETTKAYGLALTQQQAFALVNTQQEALRKTGRIELNGNTINELIFAFCDSPYLLEQNYETTLQELIQLFYDYKNETWDMIADQTLIKFMKETFEEYCQGSLELLSGQVLPQLAYHIHSGKSFKTFQMHRED